MSRASETIEWPTMLVAALIYAGWLALTFWHAALPIPLIVMAGGWLIAWHGSLQHETIHGHPTRWHAVNMAIGAVPLSLWLPYGLYRDSHMAHHRSPTSPIRSKTRSRAMSRRGVGHAISRRRPSRPCSGDC
ncbi:fatty acid desaturase [Sphingomonas sp. I4]